MPIATSCDCGRQLNLKDELAGKTVKCPQCGNPLKVPGGKATSTAVATPPPVPSKSPAGPKPSGPPSRVPREEPKEAKAGPKIVMGNFKSLDDFDESGHVKKKKKVFDKEEMTVLDVGTTGGAMAELAAAAIADVDHKPKHRCPTCGKAVKPDDVICMKCGTNVKTGKRIGEAGFTLSRGRLIAVGVVLVICGLGAAYHFTRKPPETKSDQQKQRVAQDVNELASVQGAFAAKLAEDSKETEGFQLHISYLGLEALPPLIKQAKDGSSSQKLRAVALLETLAYNGYRSVDAVEALALLKKDSNPELRERAVEALFWSAVEAKSFSIYWPPTEDDPQKRSDVVKKYALPFADNREQLEIAGIPMRKDPKTKKLFGSFGVQPPGRNLIPEAAERLEDFWMAETDRRMKLSVLIQAVRAGRMHLLGELIKYLEPDGKSLGVVSSAPDMSRVRRCLQSVVLGKTWSRWTQWNDWWEATGKKEYPRPPKIVSPPPAEKDPEKPK